MLWPTPPAAPGLTLLGKLKLNYIRSLQKPLGFKKVTPSVGSFFDIFDFDWFESWGTQFQSALQTLGITLIITTVISLVCSILLKALNACSHPLTTKQWISLRQETLEKE